MIKCHLSLYVISVSAVPGQIAADHVGAKQRDACILNASLVRSVHLYGQLAQHYSDQADYRYDIADPRFMSINWYRAMADWYRSMRDWYRSLANLSDIIARDCMRMQYFALLEERDKISRELESKRTEFIQLTGPVRIIAQDHTSHVGSYTAVAPREFCNPSVFQALSEQIRQLECELNECQSTLVLYVASI